ncbi:MAG: ABC transporter substrate-binding protein, partial [Oscillospiraceae bacterium]|nr:ABC transporter substrate-binding protein [Oscillospiraceae bacterium]
MEIKKLLAMVLALVMTFSLAACGGGNDTKTSQPSDGSQSSDSQPAGGQPSGETIALRVWGAEEDQALLKDLVEKFQAAHPDQTFD